MLLISDDIKCIRERYSHGIYFSIVYPCELLHFVPWYNAPPLIFIIIFHIV